MPRLLERLRDALRPDFEVRGEVGAGGMARVFLARDRALERDVAVKVLRPELATANGAERFLREARLLARVSHPNVVAVHEVGERDGLFFCVLERVTGRSLAERLRGGPLPVDEAVAVGDGLLAALEAAHAEGVVHRDVKPSNVILAEDDRVVLVDFGVAKAPAETDPGLTATDARPGTPGWLAPEQIAGDPATPRTDLYNAARLVWEAISGERWTPGANPERALRAGVPRRTGRVLARGLAPDPADRWPEAAAFRRALARTRRRRRWPAAAGAVLLAALLLVATVVVRGPNEEGGATPLAPAYDVALLPCEPVAAGDSVTGRQVARVASLYLDYLPRLRVVPHFRAVRWWHSAGIGADDRYGAAARALDAAHAIRCTVEPVGGSRLRIGVEPVRPDGTILPPAVVEASADAPPVAAGDALGLAVVRMLRPRLVLSTEGHTALSGQDREAVRAFLLGEDAFQRDAKPEAREYYRAALAIDPSFALARWRLIDLRRYLLLPEVEEDFTLLARDTQALGPVDQLMLKARLEPPGPARLARYRELLARFPADPYARFTYGDELFHRGPLAGVGQDSALAVLRAAARADSFLAPAWDHLAMAAVRAGRRQEASEAIAWLARLKGEGGALGIDHPTLLQLAWLERFEPARAEERRRELFGGTATGGAAAALLTEAARLGGPYMDLPATEVALGRALLGSASGTADRVTGHTAEGLGLVAAGRWSAAWERFDAAAAVERDPGARLHAALWRVVPAALGLSAAGPDERAAGRTTLVALAEEEDVATDVRAQAAWGLGLDAAAGGDGAAAARWHGRLEELVAGPGAERAAAVLAAWRAASAGRPEAALARSEPALAYRAADRIEWPFLRSATYAGRGRWWAAAGRPDAAERALRWHEAVDLEGTPRGVAQAGEVDWALGAHADLVRARLLSEAGRGAEACRRAAHVRYRWPEPDAALAGALAEAREIERASCSP